MHRALTSFLLTGFLFGCGSPPPAPRDINVVLVTVDTLRADRLGVYGGGVATPNLDALAREGALFQNAFAQSPLTLPSHSSILTGTWPTYHGARDNGRYRLSDELDTLAEMLKRAGYRTAAFVGGFPVHSRFGLGQGFDVYDDSFPRTALRLALAERNADAVLDPALAWLASDEQGPFFLWVHLFDPHAPYAAPPPFGDAYENPYDGEVAYVDKSLGAFLDTLDENTLVVVTSDHGEGLGEHGEKTHSLFVYDSTMRIPLLLRGPGVPARMVVRDQARSIDIAPTVLALVGQEGACPQCQGTSLVPALRDDAIGSLPSYAETYFPRLNLGWSELRSLRQDGWKFIAAPEPELYDLRSDPGESQNLASTNPEKLSQMASALDTLEQSTRRDEGAASELPVDPETVALLRSLGYVTSATTPSRDDRPDPKTRLPVWDEIRSGMELLARGEFDDAVAAFEAVLQKEPELLLARSYIAAAYFETGRYADSLKQCAYILEQEPNDFEAMLLLGKGYLRTGRASDAREILKRASVMNPDSPEPWVELAQMSLGQNARADADAALQKARELDDEAPSVLLLRGKLAILGQNTTEAERLFREALGATPREEDARVQLGNLLLGARRLEEAEALFLDGLALRPGSAAFHLGLGHSLALAGKMDEAIPEFERALELTPESTLVLNSLGFAYLETGQTERGAALLNRSLELHPEQPEIQELLRSLSDR